MAIGGIYPARGADVHGEAEPAEKEEPYIERTIDATRDGLRPRRHADRRRTRRTTPTPPTNLRRPTRPSPTSGCWTRRASPRRTRSSSRSAASTASATSSTSTATPIDGKTQDYVVGVREIDYDAADRQPDATGSTGTPSTPTATASSPRPANQVVCGGQPYFVSGFLGERPSRPTGSSCASTPTRSRSTSRGSTTASRSSDVRDRRQARRRPATPSSTGPSRRHGPTSTTTYDGTGGVAIGSFWRRLLYAAQVPRDATSCSPASSTTTRRCCTCAIRGTRVQKVAPFLTLDGDPYPAVVNGRILWIVDGYTTAANYPYAQRIDLRRRDQRLADRHRARRRCRAGQVNYIRNSVKATVDAYDGTVTLYEFDEPDPVLKAWNKAFGGKLVKPKTAIPAELMEHFRYPEDQFKVQRDLLTRYHVTDPQRLLLRPGLLAGAERPGASRPTPSSRRTTCSPSCPGRTSRVPAHHRARAAQPGQPGRADVGVLRGRQAAASRCSSCRRTPRSTGPARCTAA